MTNNNKGNGTANDRSDTNSNKRPPPLPLGWTQVRRKKPKVDDTSSTQPENTTKIHNNDEYECDNTDCSCNRALIFHDINKNIESSSYYTNKKGYAIFCKHSYDSEWFQGYFFPQDDSNSNKDNNDTTVVNNNFVKAPSSSPLGLLVNIRQDVDDCLQCASDEGYKEFDITIIQYKNKHKKYKVCNVVCEGGDMMNIKTPIDNRSKTLSIFDENLKTILSDNDSIKIDFETDQILCNNKIEPYITKYFYSLFKNIGCSNNVLEKFPDCSIIIGKINLFGPKHILSSL